MNINKEIPELQTTKVTVGEETWTMRAVRATEEFMKASKHLFENFDKSDEPLNSMTPSYVLEKIMKENQVTLVILSLGNINCLTYLKHGEMNSNFYIGNLSIGELDSGKYKITSDRKGWRDLIIQ